jgi:DNA-binding transcriptional LysR family regulator
MELRQLRYFIAVAEELHFRRAAERLHMSQPPLSHQLRLLEEELGCVLLARTRRRVELTPAGRAFLRDARAVLADLDRAAHNARRIHEGQTGLLRVSFAGSALLSLVPRVVHALADVHPEIDIELHERSTSDQVRALTAGITDLGLAPLPIADAAELDVEVLVRERTVAAVPAGHPLARSRSLTLRRLAQYPFVLFPRDQAPGYHDLLMTAVTSAGTPPRVIQQAAETQTIIGLVAAGTGVSLVPASVQQLALEGVVYRPVDDAPDTELAALARRGERGSGLIAAFLEAAATPSPPPTPSAARAAAGRSA